MRGMQWDPHRGFHCRDCGGSEADLLEGGVARCRSCGRSSVPSVATTWGKVERTIGGILALFAAVLLTEVAAAWAYATAIGGGFGRAFSILAFVTGFAAILVAGVGAYPGRVALGNQRLDRLYWAAPLQNPVVMGTLSTKAEARDTGEPRASGVFLMFGIGAALLLVAAAIALA